MKWVVRIQHAGLLNMLYVPHFRWSNINTICVGQLLELVHDGHLWFGQVILIDDILIWRIIALPYQGANPNDVFVGKSQEKNLVDQMKNDYGIIKKYWGYNIISINNEAMCFTTSILAIKIMRKCRP